MNTILLLLLFIALLSFAISGISAAPWLPTKNADQEKILNLINQKNPQTFVELGCGDGRLLSKVATMGHTAIGYEISIIPYLAAQIRRLFHPNKKNIHIKFKSFWNVNLKNADYIYFFLTPKIYPKLEKKFHKELHKNQNIIAYVWPLKSFQSSEQQIKGKNKIFLYKI